MTKNNRHNKIPRSDLGELCEVILDSKNRRHEANKSKDAKRIRADALRELINTLLEKLIDLEISKISYKKQGELRNLFDNVQAKLKNIGV